MSIWPFDRALAWCFMDITEMHSSGGNEGMGLQRRVLYVTSILYMICMIDSVPEAGQINVLSSYSIVL